MSPAREPYAFTEINVRAELVLESGETLDLELANVSMEFTENGIPTATMSLALGVAPLANGSVRTAQAHSRIGEITRWNEIDIYADLKGTQAIENGSPVPWPEGEFKIFSGYIAGPAYRQTAGAANFTLQAVHWLSRLAATTKFSYVLHPASVGQAYMPVCQRSSSGAAKESFRGAGPLYQEDAELDLWTKGIRPVFQDLTQKDSINIDAADFQSRIPTDLIKNNVAAEALEKFDEDRPPLKVKDIVTDSLKTHIFDNLVRLIVGREFGSSMWETLINCSRFYLFSVIPMVDTAVCAPVMKCVDKEHVWKDIRADEYSQVSISGKIPTIPIRALGLLGTTRWNSLSNPQTDSTSIQSDHLAGYADFAESIHDSDIVAGTFLISRAPPWLTNALPSALTRKSLPHFGACRTSVQRKNTNKPEETVASVTNENVELHFGDDVAKGMLIDRYLQDRQANISGRLRFDIAPGSAISLEVAGKNVPLYSGDKLYAHVYKTTITIDAVNSQAGTVLSLAYIRTEAEQEKFGEFMASEHPIYDDLWSGTAVTGQGDGAWSDGTILSGNPGVPNETEFGQSQFLA